MRLVIEQILDMEIIHYASGSTRVTSRHHRVSVDGLVGGYLVELPSPGWDRALGKFRLARRSLRLDKCNAIPVGGDLVVVRRGEVFHVSGTTRDVARTLKLANCRNVLHQAMAVVDEQEVYFGEYGANPSRGEVPVYRSRDGGRSWDRVFVFPSGTIRHVHGCQWDPVERRIWIFTGDLDNECHVLSADRDFQQVEWIGDGRQTFRACGAFFEKDAVHWIMDSPLEACFQVRLDRRTRQIERRAVFPGPVWYTKRLSDGMYLAATTYEAGPGVRDRFAHLLVSRDLEQWEEVHRFEHDGLPTRFFKPGVVAFADGEQSSAGFLLFFEAIRGLDGRAALCRLEP